MACHKTLLLAHPGPLLLPHSTPIQPTWLQLAPGYLLQTLNLLPQALIGSFQLLAPLALLLLRGLTWHRAVLLLLLLLLVEVPNVTPLTPLVHLHQRASLLFLQARLRYPQGGDKSAPANHGNSG